MKIEILTPRSSYCWHWHCRLKLLKSLQIFLSSDRHDFLLSMITDGSVRLLSQGFSNLLILDCLDWPDCHRKACSTIRCCNDYFCPGSLAEPGRARQVTQLTMTRPGLATDNYVNLYMPQRNMEIFFRLK